MTHTITQEQLKKVRYYLTEGLKYKPISSKEPRPVTPADVLASYLQDALSILDAIEKQPEDK